MVQVALKDNALDIEIGLGIGQQDLGRVLFCALTICVEQQAVVLQSGVFARALDDEGVDFLG